MGDHDDCVSFPYYFASLVIAILLGAVTSYMFTIMYNPALIAAFASANDTEANSAPNTGGGHNTSSGSNTGFGHTTGHALGSDGCFDATTDEVALVFGIGSSGHATLASNQNSDPIIVKVAAGSSQNSDSIIVQVAAGSGLNFDHSTDHVLSFGRSSGAALGSGGCSDAALGFGRSSDAALNSGQHFDFVTIHVAGGSGLSFEPSIGHALGSGGLSDDALGSDTGFGQNFDFITVHEAAFSSPNSEPSTGHALGSDRPSDPTIDHAALVAGTDSSCLATSDSSPSSGLTTAKSASGSNPSSGPTIVHDASCNTPTRQATFSKDPIAAFFNAASSLLDSNDEAH